jgi:hypothetical protein
MNNPPVWPYGEEGEEEFRRLLQKYLEDEKIKGGASVEPAVSLSCDQAPVATDGTLSSGSSFE